MKMHIDQKRVGFQMTRERRRSNAEWPAWLNAAWNTPITDVGALYPTPGEDRGEGTVTLRTISAGPVIVQWNDWIIRDPDGALWLTDSADPFIANIEVAEPEIRHVTPAEQKALIAPFRAAAIDQVAEEICGIVADDGRFREDIRRILRENFGEFGTNDHAELMKLRGFYRQIVATFGQDDVARKYTAALAACDNSAHEIERLRAELLKSEAHADRLATALGWLSDCCATHVPAVVDALRAHAMRRGANFQDAGPIQSNALLPARKLTCGFVFYPSAGKRGVLVTQDALPERTKLVIMPSGSLYHLHSSFTQFGVTVGAVTADPCMMETGDEGDAAEALRLAGETAAGVRITAPILACEAAPALYGAAALVRKPLASHPVDAMNQLGVPMDAETEKTLRAHCDAPVDADKPPLEYGYARVEPPDVDKARREMGLDPELHCSDCAPEFGCWNGREACRKVPLRRGFPPGKDPRDPDGNAEEKKGL